MESSSGRRKISTSIIGGLPTEFPIRARFDAATLDKKDHVAHDTPFLIRNRAGHNIIVTPLGDRRGGNITIENNKQQYIHFIVKDEFSSLTAYNREVEVIIDCAYVQERPMTFSMSKLMQHSFSID